MDRAQIAQAAAFAIDTVAGKGKATVTLGKDGVYTIKPSKEQAAILRANFESAMAGKPSLTVDVFPIVGPYIIRKALPYAVSALSLAFLVGYSIRRRKDIGRG